MYTGSGCRQKLRVAAPLAKPGPGAASGPPERICELSVRQLSDTTASAAAMSEGLMPRLEHVRVGRDGLPLAGTAIIAAISCAEQVNGACVHLLNEGTRALRGGGGGGGGVVGMVAARVSLYCGVFGPLRGARPPCPFATFPKLSINTQPGAPAAALLP